MKLTTLVIIGAPLPCFGENPYLDLIARKHLPRKAPAEAPLAEEPRPRQRSNAQIVQSIIRKGME
ncbi:hypothetical protein [Candidatus Palauibacter sp.]|uniref:hypothetical protein n=1 Tax=Candidatus Palauibacter sp. TaxID=3101350 RepID=UPI003B5B546F